MQRTRTLYVLPAALLLLVAATRQGTHRVHGPVVQESASEARPADMQGTFVFTSEGSDDVQAAIRDGTRKMSFIKRPIARSRLRKTNQPTQVVQIEHTPAEVSIALDGRKPIVTPADGRMIKWTREDGEVFDVNSIWEGGRLKETFVAGDGSRENTFTLSPDGQLLTMQVTIRSPQLPGPILYKLNYRRKG